MLIKENILFVRHDYVTECAIHFEDIYEAFVDTHLYVFNPSVSKTSTLTRLNENTL